MRAEWADDGAPRPAPPTATDASPAGAALGRLAAIMARLRDP